MDSIPTHDEILAAVKACDLNKALGYDDNMKFVKEMWHFVGNDIIQFVQNLFQTGKFSKVINTTWVTLIPKTLNATSLDKFRLMSIVSCLYKIISKILTGRFKMVVPQIISEEPSSSVQNRSIHDSVLTENEALT